MRRTIGSSLALVLNVAVFGPAARAELHCEQPLHQAGQVRNGLQLAHRFTFVNRGRFPVEITDVRSSCGCLTPQLEKRTFSPGEAGSLLLSVNTLSLAQGSQSWRTRLICREGETTSELELVIVGDVVTEVLVQPSALTLPADAPGVHEITVTDSRTKPLTVRATDVGATCLRAVVGEARRDGSSSVQRIRLEVPADCPPGRHDVAVHLYTDDPEYREFTVPVTVIKRPRTCVNAVPRQITFDGDKGQPLPSRTVQLSAAEGAVEIASVDADDPAVSCSTAKGSGGTASVRVQIDHTRLTGDLNTTVRVHVVKPVVETVTIQVLCIVR